MKTKIITIILSVLLIASVGINVYQYVEASNATKELTVLANAKDELTSEIESKTEEINKVSAELEDLNIKVAELTTDVESMTNVNMDMQAEIDSMEKSISTLADIPKNLDGNVGVLPSPVEGAVLVDSYETWGGYGDYSVETYSNGMKVMKTLNCKYSNWTEEYWLLRTDYSDGLQDSDGNGLDDRDPLNNCGYSDTNFNCIIDGAPTPELGVPEAEATHFVMCDHNVMHGVWNICSHPDCVELANLLKGDHIN